MACCWRPQTVILTLVPAFVKTNKMFCWSGLNLCWVDEPLVVCCRRYSCGWIVLYVNSFFLSFFFSGVFVQFMWKLQSLQVMTGIARLDVTLLVWYLCLMAKPCVYRCFLSHRFLLWFKIAVHVNAQMSLHVLTSSLMQHCIKKKPCYNLILLVSLLLV